MKVALVGIPVLNACGLRYLIGRRWPDFKVTVCNMGEHGWEDADCHIVSASALASLARFFMSRLDKVMLLSYSAAEQEPVMAMLSPLAKEDEIYAMLENLITNATEAPNAQIHTSLSSREMEVIKLTAAGKTSRQIAEALFISTNTVLTHRKNIAAKTGMHTVSAITHFAMLHGLLR